MGANLAARHAGYTPATHADDQRDGQRDAGGRHGDDDRVADGLAEDLTAADAERDAQRPAHQTEHAGFYEELKHDDARSGAQRLAEADLLDPLGHADQHDVHHADAAHEERDRGDGPRAAP